MAADARELSIPTHKSNPGPANPRRGKMFVAAMLILLIVRFTAMSAYRGAMTSYEAWNGGDFSYFYHAGKNLREGHGIYLADSGWGYVYTPLVAIVMQPFARLPMRTAFRIWTAVQTICILAAAALCGLALGSWRDLGIRLALMIVMGFRFWTTDMNFLDGQTNFVLVLLLAAAILAATRNQIYIVAVLIAIAALCKTWMLGLLLYLLVQKSWRAAVTCLIAFIAGVVFLFTYVGWAQFPDFLRANHAMSVQTGMMAYSIPGFAKAYLKSNTFIQPLLNNPAAYYGFLGLAYALLGAGFLFLAMLRPARTPYETSLRIGLITMSVLLVLPVCHPTYVVLCLPLLWTLVTGPFHTGGRGRMALAGGGTVIYIGLTFCLPVFTLIPSGYQTGWPTLLLGGYFYAVVLLWGLALAGLWLEQSRAEAARSSAGRSGLSASA